jgi:hypothetical protein
MILTKALYFSGTAVQFAKKAKADRVVVLCKSIVSGHGRMKARGRLGEKLEFIDLDPIVGQAVLYKEEKKIRSIRDHQIAAVPRLQYTNQIDSKWRSICPEPQQF